MTDIQDVLAERGSRYGRFERNAMVSQMLKSVLFSTNRDLLLEHYQREALDMICSKLSRIVCGDPNYADSWRDIAGFATLVVNILEGKE